MGAHHKFTELREQIGREINTARSVMCITQMNFANQFGISYQQIDFYRKLFKAEVVTGDNSRDVKGENKRDVFAYKHLYTN